MKKIGIIAAIIVVIVGGALVGINYYEGRVTRGIKEMMTQLPPDWKGEVDYVEYSLFGNDLVLGGFSLTINSQEGPYVLKASEILIDSLDASVFRSGMPGRLANSITFKNYSFIAPSEATQETEFMVMNEVTGNFGHMADLIQSNAPAEVLLPVLYQIRATHLTAKNFTIKDESMTYDTCVFADTQGRAVTALTARELVVKDIKMYSGGQLACTFETMTMSMDMSALASSYVPGKEMQLYHRLFDPSVQASFSFAASKMKMEPVNGAPGGEIQSMSLQYANTETELTLQGKLVNFIIPVDEEPGSINIWLDMDCKVTDNAFNPLKLDVEFKDMGHFNMLAELMGRAPASSKIRRLEASYKDEGLIELGLNNMAKQQGIGVGQARQAMQEEIRANLTEHSNPLVADLGRNLEKMVGNPGTMTLTLAPDQPMSSQQFSMYLLLQPQALNYNFQTTAP